jgi:F-type H+-transporting ATPase subunit a
MEFLQTEAAEVAVTAQTLFTIGEMPVTNSMLTAVLCTVLVVIALVIINSKKFTMSNPSKLQVIVEYMVEGMLGFISKVAGSEKIARTILPIIGTLFIYIALMNLLTTFVPFMDAISYNGVPLFRTPTSDFNVTVSIAITMIITAQIFSISKKNIFGHIGQYFKIVPIIKGFRKGISAGFIAIIEAFVGILDIISEFAKIISLSLRLFGNMFAGVVVLGVIMSLVAIVLPLPVIMLGLLAGVLQAVVFGALVSSYFMSALQE